MFNVSKSVPIQNMFFLQLSVSNGRSGAVGDRSRFRYVFYTVNWSSDCVLLLGRICLSYMILVCTSLLQPLLVSLPQRPGKDVSVFHCQYRLLIVASCQLFSIHNVQNSCTKCGPTL